LLLGHLPPLGNLHDGPATNPMAVADAELHVHGLEALCLGDASIMPTVVSGNTNAACIMIGEKASDLMLAAA
jgi:choline dehydrogenase